MVDRKTLLTCVAVAWLGMALPVRAAEEDLNGLLEKAIKDAAKRAAPCVVQINTLGGSDIVVTGPRGTQVRKAMGPTTGLILEADGFIISSAFNFVNKPTTILVGIPGRKRPEPATIVATDSSRMLTLLKINATGLPVPVLAPRKDVAVGHWGIALGRTLDPNIANLPSISAGIISAVERIWGRAFQSDAKISPVNYGGPLVDIRGRVIGILVPASPSGNDSTAGTEWYDSGIGFSIPMDDILRVLPRLKKGENLTAGLLGVSLQNADIYGSAPVIGTVVPGSTAAKAGFQPGDLIVEIDGQPVERMAQIKHLIGPKYEGDTITVKIKRGGKEQTFANMKLVGALAAFDHAFLGILPMRDDPELGVAIRDVYAKSPAAKAGLKAGDRIMKIGMPPRPLIALNGLKSGRDQLFDLLNQIPAGTQVTLEVVRKGGKKKETVKVRLDSMTETKVALVPESLPEVASFKKAGEPRVTIDRLGKVVRPPKKKPDAKAAQPETGLLKRHDASGEHEYYVFVHEDYDPNLAHGVVVWLHPPGKFTKDDVEAFQDTWEDFCRDNHLILVCPITQNKRGWLPSESGWVVAEVRNVMTRYTVDPQRVVAHGMGVGGQMAFHLGFESRDLFRGVATMGAVLTSTLKENQANQRLSFFVAAGDKDPLVKSIAQSAAKLSERKFPVVHREIKNVAAQYYDKNTLLEVIRWIDSLDRM
jgi:S1-C subfamily serine protease/predicted esterase